MLALCLSDCDVVLHQGTRFDHAHGVPDFSLARRLLNSPQCRNEDTERSIAVLVADICPPD